MTLRGTFSTGFWTVSYTHLDVYKRQLQDVCILRGQGILRQAVNPLPAQHGWGKRMKRIYVHNGIVFFYGNPAGYLGDGTAVIDCMFQKEELVSFVKEQFLVEPVFREGVYDRLSEGGGVKETAEVSIGEGRRLRIYQLGQDSPIMMRFISLAHVEWRMTGYRVPVHGAGRGLAWVTKEQLEEEYALPSAFRAYRQALEVP